jgi:hypothetical protein
MPAFSRTLSPHGCVILYDAGLDPQLEATSIGVFTHAQPSWL